MELLAKGNSKHHLFTYHEIRAKLLEIYGYPDTDDDHIWLQRKVKEIHKQMPTVMIDADFHKDLHNR